MSNQQEPIQVVGYDPPDENGIETIVSGYKENDVVYIEHVLQFEVSDE